jgi:imidazolonepropionase-like amidohydrolase
VIAIRCARLFDGEAFRGRATVLVDDGVIVGVESERLELDDRWQVIDCGEDTTVLPGLIDTHTHLVADSKIGALDRVPGMTDDQLDAVITASLADQLAAGVTTVRDLGDLRFAAVTRRDRQQMSGRPEPSIVAAGPPITTPGGHCHFLGGVITDEQSLRAAVADRVARGVDLVKVMTSGGGSTPGTDMARTQFDAERLILLVELSHAAGLPVAAHAHGLGAIEQAVEVGVDTIEHCSGMTAGGMEMPEATLAGIAQRGIAVSGIIPIRSGLKPSDAPKPVQEYLARTGLTLEAVRDFRVNIIRRLHAHGVAVVTGLDSGLNPAMGHGRLTSAFAMFVDAGLPSAAVLAAATSRAAEVCRLAQRKGRVKPGYDADLVVVDGNAEADPMVASRVRIVIRAGVVVTR